ncbi:MAG: lipoate--protein ligase family protein [Terriglobia bacterium]
MLDGPQSGQFNMALDETLLDGVSQPQACPQTYLRFYQWIRPTLSLGISQKAERLVDFDFCRVHGIDVVRRPTGGKAVLHHQELTYSVISNDPAFFPIADISKTYCRIAGALQNGFHSLGVETTLATGRDRSAAPGPLPAACFALSNRFEVLWQDRKLAGSAQRRTKNAFLQHGSILIEFNPELVSNVLRSCDISSFLATVTDLKTCLGSVPSIPDLMGAMCRGFEAVFGIQLVNRGLSEDLVEKAHDLASQRSAC